MPRNYRIYRPNASNTGSATEWQLSFKENEKYDQYQFFLVGARQTGTDENGNAKFAWKEGQINAKLGELDLGEIIAVLDRRKESVGTNGSLFHSTPGGGNKVIGFKRGDKGGFYLTMSAQDKDKNASGKVSQVLSDADGAVLSVLLKKAIERMYAW
jgi:hypothetical protein